MLNFNQINEKQEKKRVKPQVAGSPLGEGKEPEDAAKDHTRSGQCALGAVAAEVKLVKNISALC